MRSTFFRSRPSLKLGTDSIHLSSFMSLSSLCPGPRGRPPLLPFYIIIVFSPPPGKAKTRPRQIFAREQLHTRPQIRYTGPRPKRGAF